MPEGMRKTTSDAQEGGDRSQRDRGALASSHPYAVGVPGGHRRSGITQPIVLSYTVPRSPQRGPPRTRTPVTPTGATATRACATVTPTGATAHPHSGHPNGGHRQPARRHHSAAPAGATAGHPSPPAGHGPRHPNGGLCTVRRPLSRTHGTCLRYEGHRPKHARLHSHGRPSPPHARHPGNVQDATAPMPT